VTAQAIMESAMKYRSLDEAGLSRASALKVLELYV
jgi:hypothetical protein